MASGRRYYHRTLERLAGGGLIIAGLLGILFSPHSGQVPWFTSGGVAHADFPATAPSVPPPTTGGCGESDGGGSGCP